MMVTTSETPSRGSAGRLYCSDGSLEVQRESSRGERTRVLRRATSLCGHDHSRDHYFLRQDGTLRFGRHEREGERFSPVDIHLHHKTKHKMKKKEKKKEKKAAKRLHKSEKIQIKVDKLKGLLLQRQLSVIAFVNPLSGAQLGAMVMPHLKAILGDDHVFDILSDGILPAYEFSLTCV